MLILYVLHGLAQDHFLSQLHVAKGTAPMTWAIARLNFTKRGPVKLCACMIQPRTLVSWGSRVVQVVLAPLWIPNQPSSNQWVTWLVELSRAWRIQARLQAPRGRLWLRSGAPMLPTGAPKVFRLKVQLLGHWHAKSPKNLRFFLFVVVIEMPQHNFVLFGVDGISINIQHFQKVTGCLSFFPGPLSYILPTLGWCLNQQTNHCFLRRSWCWPRQVIRWKEEALFQQPVFDPAKSQDSARIDRTDSSELWWFIRPGEVGITCDCFDGQDRVVGYRAMDGSFLPGASCEHHHLYDLYDISHCYDGKKSI